MEPNTLDWERSAIATAIADPPSMAAALDLLPSDFTGPNMIAWAEILTQYQTHGTIDTQALIHRLRDDIDWTRRGNGLTIEEYLSQIAAFRGSDMEQYVQEIIKASTLRTLRNNAAAIVAEAEFSGRDVDELLDMAENRILSIRRDRTTGAKSLGDLISVFMPRMQGLRDGTIRPAWEPDLLALREVIGYAEDQDFILIAGRPGEGKSSYLRFEAWHRAKRGEPVLILNYENSELEYPRYFLAMETGINSDKLKRPGLLSETEIEQLGAAAERLARLPLHIQTTERNIKAALAAARRAVAEKHITMLILDYVQLLENGCDNRATDIARTTGGLRGFSLQYRIPTLAAAQLNREIEKRSQEDADPKLSDLRESGALEQDATIVIFPRPLRSASQDQLLAFPENRALGPGPITRPIAVPVRFHVVKNRNGSTGPTEFVKWNKSTDIYQTLVRARP